MKRLIILFAVCCLFCLSAPAYAQFIPLTETDLFGPLPGDPTPALAGVTLESSDTGFTLTVSSNPVFLQQGAIFDELYFNLDPARTLQPDRVAVDASVGGSWQLVQNSTASRFGMFNYLLKGDGLEAGQGDPLVVHFTQLNIQPADLLWNNAQGWSLAARLRDPLGQSSLYLAASTVQSVPLSPAVLFLASGLGGFGLIRRRLG